jgi:predicted Na+-dependent transporter
VIVRLPSLGVALPCWDLLRDQAKPLAALPMVLFNIWGSLTCNMFL